MGARGSPGSRLASPGPDRVGFVSRHITDDKIHRLSTTAIHFPLLRHWVCSWPHTRTRLGHGGLARTPFSLSKGRQTADHLWKQRLFNSLVLEYLRKSGRSVYLHTCLPHTATRQTTLPARPTTSRVFLPLTSRLQKCPGYGGNTVTSSGRGTQRSRYSCPWWWLAASPMDCRFLHGCIY